MADLSGMYSQLGENVRNIDPFNAFLKGQMASQELKNQNFNYQKAQEEYEAQKGLRALFAQNAQPSLSEIGALSPEFAQAYAKNQFAMNKDLLEMQKTKNEIQQGQQKISETDIESAAKASFPALETYDRNIASGMPEQQALNIFHAMNGDAVSKAKQAGASWVQGSYDPDKATPDGARALNARYGAFTTRDKAAQAGEEAFAGQAGRARVPGIHTTPEGYSIQTPGVDLGVTPFNPNAGQQPLFRNPPTGTGLAVPPGMSPAPQQPPMQSEPQSNIPAQDIDAFRAYYQSLPPGREKDAARDALAKAARESVPGGGVHEDQGQVTTPEELANIRTKNKARETAAVKEAEAEVGRKEENTRILESFERAGDPSRIEKLIEESTSGPVESKLAAAKGFSGKGTPGMEKIAELGSIAGELRKTIERSPGAQSDKDVALAALDAADIANPNKPYNERLAGFKEFNKIMNVRKSQMEKSSAAQPPKEAVVGRRKAALDMFQKGEIDEAKFHEMWGE